MPIKTLAELDKEHDESFKSSGKIYWGAKLAKVIENESRRGEDPNVIWGALKVKPDFTQGDMANDTWRDDAKI
jgi:hypothetical protein